MLGSRVYRSLSPGTHYFPEGVEKLELLVAAPLQVLFKRRALGCRVAARSPGEIPEGLLKEAAFVSRLKGLKRHTSMGQKLKR